VVGWGGGEGEKGGKIWSSAGNKKGGGEEEANCCRGKARGSGGTIVDCEGSISYVKRRVFKVKKPGEDLCCDHKGGAKLKGDSN